MTTCRHPVLLCENGTPAGTVARCQSCGIVTIIPPVAVNGKGRTRTIAGLGLPAKRRLEMEFDMGHASALAEEGHWGARE